MWITIVKSLKYALPTVDKYVDDVDMSMNMQKNMKNIYAERAEGQMCTFCMEKGTPLQKKHTYGINSSCVFAKL
jgi:hypothetical protein